MSQPTLQDISAQGEGLTVEFKSDRGPLDDAYLLKKLVERGDLHLAGGGRSAHYELGKTRNNSE